MEYYDYDAWERNNYRDDEYDEYDNSDYEYDCHKNNLLMEQMMYEEEMNNE